MAQFNRIYLNSEAFGFDSVCMNMTDVMLNQMLEGSKERKFRIMRQAYKKYGKRRVRGRVRGQKKKTGNLSESQTK